MAKTFDEADVLRILDLGSEDAYDLLVGEIPTAEKRFKALDKAIVDFLKDVQKVFPDARYYTASGGFHLMLGNPHSEQGLKAQPELIALSGRAAIGDGDF